METIYILGNFGDRRNVILEMLHSCTPAANKGSILSSFTDTCGGIRILVATIAFGMGVDCKGVWRTVHFGPPKNVESLIQESGRAGRDGLPSYSHIIYNGLLLSHVDQDIKEYINTKECRRKELLKHFVAESEIKYPTMSHLCCENCALQCTCESSACVHDFKYLSQDCPSSDQQVVNERDVTEAHKQAILKHLTACHKSLVMELVNQFAHGRVETLFNVKLLIGFSNFQIEQVLENCSKLFTISDICNMIEIWNIKHAYKIHSTLSEVFCDIPVLESHDDLHASFVEDDDSEDELSGMTLFEKEWESFIGDDNLIDLIMENLSETEMDNSSDVNNSMHMGLPDAVVEVLNNFSFEQ